MSPDFAANLLWLLLPVAAASGFFAARRKYADEKNGVHVALAPDYFKGLNYLLNEQPDKAIEVFIRILDAEHETAEIHLALGNLFRRRGEVGRAIQIHQNLIERAELSPEQRHAALFELGLDYTRSGLLDRAEELFGELLKSSSHKAQALTQLVDIYQQEKDWDKAIECARQSAAISGLNMSKRIAHFFCEQAEAVAAEGDTNQAMTLVESALNVDANCARASLIEARLLMHAERIDAAIKVFQGVEQQDPEFISETIHPLMECYRAVGDMDGFIGYLERLSERHMRTTPILVLAELLAEQQGKQQAIAFLSEKLRLRPSIRGLNRMVEYALDSASGEAKENLLMLKDLTNKLLDGRALYRCKHCGFTGKSLHWQCPACGYWATITRIPGVEGE